MQFLQIKVGNKKKVGLFLVYLITVSLLFIMLFLFLPRNTQQSLAIGLYILSVIFGLFIGSLVAKLKILKERLTKEKEEFEKKNENIHTYMANVVHDLRSPAASIYMISELLEDDLSEISDSNKELLSSIRKTSATMLDRICCILDNARLEKGLSIRKIDIGNPYEILTTAINKHQIFAIEKDITIDLCVNNNLPDTLFDKEALDSVFCNLISNAIKYSMVGTTITISNVLEKGKIRFSVKDQGLGMTTEDLEKVFSQFAKLSARPTGNEDSSGLGLSIVKRFVELMGGEVFAQSEGKNKGSTFSFTLPTNGKANAMTA
jgi:signal transduction histidine kinase